MNTTQTMKRLHDQGPLGRLLVALLLFLMNLLALLLQAVGAGAEKYASGDARAIRKAKRRKELTVSPAYHDLPGNVHNSPYSD